MPDLPDQGVDRNTRYVLEMYADEISEHAAGIGSIKGMSPRATGQYKECCFEAAKLLRQASELLRANINIADVRIVPLAVAVPKVEGGWNVLGKLFGRGVTPCLAVVAGGLALRWLLGI